MKVIADNKIPFLKGVLEPFAEVEYHQGNLIDSKIIKDADALIVRTRTQCNEKLLKNSNVKFIATATIGYDHIDTDYCNKNNIFWTNAAGCNSSSVQQYLASVLISLSVKKGFSLRNKVLGVVGVGNVGSKIVKLGEILGLKVYLNDPPRMRKEGPCQFISLDGILRECDIITFHVPLIMKGIDATFHLAGNEFFKKINKGSIIINSSRGEVVDSLALKEAFKSGKVSGAVIDVWENEPCIDNELLSMVDFATPHIAGYSADGKANGTALSVQALSRYFNLGIDDWESSDIPEPSNNLININCKNKGDDEIVNEAVLFTYHVKNDDEKLRNSVETFEKQRGDYPVRREFHAYAVKLSENRPEAEKRLKRLGFNI